VVVIGNPTKTSKVPTLSGSKLDWTWLGRPVEGLSGPPSIFEYQYSIPSGHPKNISPWELVVEQSEQLLELLLGLNSGDKLVYSPYIIIVWSE
jgi:hypothetical protein